MPPLLNNALVQNQAAAQALEMDHSGLTLSLGIDSNSVETANSVQGADNLLLFGNLLVPHDPPVLMPEIQLLDLNMPLEVELQQPEIPVALLHADLQEEMEQQLPKAHIDVAMFVPPDVQVNDATALQMSQDQPPPGMSELHSQDDPLPDNALLPHHMLMAPFAAQEDNYHQQIVGTAAEPEEAAPDKFQEPVISATVNQTVNTAASELPSPDSGSSNPPPGFPLPIFKDQIHVGACQLLPNAADPIMQKMFLSQAQEELHKA